jgi:hypothetical protein
LRTFRSGAGDEAQKGKGQEGHSKESFHEYLGCSHRAKSASFGTKSARQMIMPPSALRQIKIRCPWRERTPHNPKRAETLGDELLADISKQIAANGYRPLPLLGIAKKLLRCQDCFVVWVAASPFDEVEESKICGTSTKPSYGNPTRQ